MNRVLLFIKKIPLNIGGEFHAFAPADIANDLPNGFTAIHEDPKVEIFENAIIVTYRCEQQTVDLAYYAGSDISRV